MGEHVQQHFRVGVRVDVAQIGPEQVLAEIISIGQVAVVSQGNAIRAVHIERLGFGGAGTASSRIAHVAYTHVAHQTTHMTGMENIPYQAIVLAEEKPFILKCHNARRVLAPVLKYSQRIIERLIDVGSTDDADNATHG
mgnify:CR=1 FL=1